MIPDKNFRHPPTAAPKDPDAFISEVIEMAWADDVPFTAIRMATGLSEEQVTKLMKIHLKPSSYRLWRERIRHRKHQPRAAE